MITHRAGNLLEQPDLDVLVHQANLFHTFGAGIAKAIKEKFPYAYQADTWTEKGARSKLGSFSIGFPQHDGQPLVVNLYSQTTLYPSSQTSYDAMLRGLRDLRGQLEAANDISNTDKPYSKVGFPYNMGCGLADGNWEIVKVIIEQAFEGSGIEVVIVKLPEGK